MNTTLPMWAETTVEILAIVVLIALVVISLLLLIWMIDASIQSEKNKKEYIDTLDEHDKSVVISYINSKKFPKWRKAKKQ